MNRVVLPVLFGLFALCAANAVHASVIQVPGDYTELRDAVEAAYTGDTIEVSSSYVETSYAWVLVDKSITIRTVGTGMVSVPPMFVNNASGLVTLEGLEFREASMVTDSLSVGVGLVLVEPASLVVVAGQLNGNNLGFSAADGYGLLVVEAEAHLTSAMMMGAHDGTWIGARDGASVVTESCAFSDALSGAVVVENSTYSSLGDDFESNSSENGGCIWAEDDSQVDVSLGFFQNNQAFRSGGCIGALNSHVMIANSSFKVSNAAVSGGLLYAKADEYYAGSGSNYEVELISVELVGAAAATSGGVVHLANVSALIEEMSVSSFVLGGDNSGEHIGGGAIAVIGGEATIVGMTSTGQTATYAGGVLLVAEGAVLSVSDSMFTGRDGDGVPDNGGFLAVVEAQATVEASTIQGFGAENSGGAIFVYGDQSIGVDDGTMLKLVDTSIVDSSLLSEPSKGGAIYSMDGQVYISGGVIQNAQSTASGGGIYSYWGLLDLWGGLELSNLESESGGAIALFGYDPEESTASLANIVITDAQAEYAGGAIWTDNVGLTISDSEFVRTSVKAGNGGAIRTQRGEMQLSGVTVHNVSAEYGGAIAVNDLTRLDIKDSRFINNVAFQGSFVFGSDVLSMEWRRNRFCNGEDVESSGSAVQVADVSWLDVHNNVWLHSDAWEGQGMLIGVATGGSAFVYNNTFVGGEGDLAVASDDVGATASIYNNIFWGMSRTYSTLALSSQYNLWWSDIGAAGVPDNLGPNSFAADPVFEENFQGDCDTSLLLQARSPAIDAGDPTVLDRDGSVSDIGAYGGLQSDLNDLDGDGFFSNQDCDDTNASIFPGAVEIWYDGIDQNCDGNDSDQDGDGFDASAVDGNDCNDEDPKIAPGRPDFPGDGIDSDCDGRDPQSWFGGGGCTTPSTQPGLLFGGLTFLLLGGRMRQRRAN